MANDENAGEAVKQRLDPTTHAYAHRRHKRATSKRVLLVVRRIAIFACSLLLIALAFVACYDAMGLLRGRQNPPTASEVDSYDSVATRMGDKTIRESPLVTTDLQGSTAPLNGTLYVTGQTVSFSPCAGLAESLAPTFSDSFLRSLYAAFVDGAAYNITAISNQSVELIAPVVDCAVTNKGTALVTSAKFFFLVRQRNDTDNVSLLVATLSNQQYTIPDQEEEGPASVAVVQLVNDMRATDLNHYFVVSTGYPYAKFAFRVYEYVNTTAEGLWTLQNVPKTARESVKILQTACKTGFYIKAASEQSNINNYRWIHETDAVSAVGKQRWVSVPDLHDSWAWVHGVQFFMAMSMLSDLLILCLTTYHNIIAGKWWIGDAMVTLSNSQVISSVAVFFSWFMNEFWSLHEFCIQEANLVSGFSSMIIYESHTRIDMLILYIGCCGLIGRVFRERIDPLLAVGCFLIGYEARVTIINWFPALRDDIVAFSTEFYLRSVSAAVPQQEKISPMGFWTIRPLGKRNYIFVFKCLFPIYITLVLIVIHVILRKIHRHFYPETIHVMRNTSGTATSENERSLITQKRVLTLFEIATGAQLEDRFGVVSDFEPSVFVKAVKHASPDGIYSTGFVIANGKFLIQTRDYWSIVLMKILRRRYANIYVYDVDGRTVKQTARLVYPNTLTFADLLAVNVGLLS